MNELKHIIPLLIIIWAGILYVRIRNTVDAVKKIKAEKEKPVEEKRCPAHKWEWEEQLGMPGIFYIRCQWCRKLPGWEK